PSELRLQLRRLGGDVRASVIVVRVVRALDREIAQTLQDRVDLAQRAFRGLHDRDAVLRVAGGDLEASDLRTQALRDGEPGRVVSRTVDPEAARELLERLVQVALRGGQVAVRVERADVGVDLHTHCDSSMMWVYCAGPSVVRLW